MEKRRLASALLNPHEVKHPVRKGLLLGAGAAAIAGLSVTTWLHRSNHGGVEYKKPVKKAFRAINFMFTGMPKAHWWDHLVHHKYSDTYGEEDHKKWNETRPEGAPEAPVEAFRDPYSVRLESYPQVLFNTGGLHRKAWKKIMPFVLGLAEHDKQRGVPEGERQHWPEHFRRVDIEEADPTALRNKRPAVGLIALGVAETVAFGPAVSVPAMAVHVGALEVMGGYINAVAHTGRGKGFWHRVKVLAGREEPIPQDDGSLASDIMTGREGYFFGEPHHNYHHENPGDPYISGDTLLRDPGGFVIKRLVQAGLAETPGAVGASSEGPIALAGELPAPASTTTTAAS